MGDDLYPDSPIHVRPLDGDRLVITSDSDRGGNLYASCAEWAALEAAIRATTPPAVDPNRYPCISCGQPADGISAQCKACEAKPAVRIEVKL